MNVLTIVKKGAALIGILSLSGSISDTGVWNELKINF